MSKTIDDMMREATEAYSNAVANEMEALAACPGLDTRFVTPDGYIDAPGITAYYDRRAHLYAIARTNARNALRIYERTASLFFFDRFMRPSSGSPEDEAQELTVTTYYRAYESWRRLAGPCESGVLTKKMVMDCLADYLGKTPREIRRWKDGRVYLAGYRPWFTWTKCDEALPWAPDADFMNRLNVTIKYPMCHNPFNCLPDFRDTTTFYRYYYTQCPVYTQPKYPAYTLPKYTQDENANENESYYEY